MRFNNSSNFLKMFIEKNLCFKGDEIIGFCTEGTPANISTATSHSDLSLIAPSEDGSETNVILRQSMKMVNIHFQINILLDLVISYLFFLCN